MNVKPFKGATLTHLNQILAGTRGYFQSRPELGLLEVDPIFPGSFQAMRKAGRWQCHTLAGETLFVPYREFKRPWELDPADERYSPLSVPAVD